MIDDSGFFVDIARSGSPDCILKVNGLICVRNAARLQEALLDALVASPTTLTVNLGAVSAIDASGLDVLVAAHRRATAAGTRLHFEGAHTELAHVLSQNGLPTTPDPNVALTTATETSRRATPRPLDANQLGLR